MAEQFSTRTKKARGVGRRTFDLRAAILSAFAGGDSGGWYANIPGAFNAPDSTGSGTTGGLRI